MRDARMALETWQFDQDTIDWFWWDRKIWISQLAPKEVVGAARNRFDADERAGQNVPQLDAGRQVPVA